MSAKNWTVFFKNRGRELIGVSFVGSALFFSLALLTHHPLDPSFNLSSNSEVYNLSGSLGAYFSGPVLQAFGYASYFLGIFLFVWGVKILTKQEASYFLLRVTAVIFAIIFLASLFALFKTSSSWEYSSYGGFAGMFVKSRLIDNLNGFVYVLLIGFCSAIVILFSLKISISSFLRGLLHLNLVFLSSFYRKAQKLLLILCEKAASFFKKKFFKKRIKDIDPTINKRKNKISKVATEFKATPVAKSNEYKLPELESLTQNAKKKVAISRGDLNDNAKKLQQTLEDFGIKGKICDIKPGPVVTLYEFEPAPGIKSSRIIGLSDDVARSMSAVSARISLLPAKNALGIELPNQNRDMVMLREILESEEYFRKEISLPLGLGQNIGGDVVVADLAKMPHLLVAGTTGSGKSVAINTMILSLIYRLSPEQCKFIMIDPKMLELSVYDGIPHLLAPVITDSKKAVNSLSWVVQEMENRYKLMSSLGVRNISGYNEMIKKAIAKGETLTRTIQTGFDPETGKPIFEDVELDMTEFPYIVVIIDEMADLMVVAGKDIESYLQRLAQMARASGIHLIIATQRPSVDVITGVIKANFPTRISFQVTSKIDSRTILGEQGAEQLLGMGDMLFMYGGSKILRVHGPFVSDVEVRDTVESLKQQGEPAYVNEILVSQDDNDGGDNGVIAPETGDELFDKAVQIILRDKKVSISYVQRQLKIGYNRAANLIEEMERQGIISEPNNSGRREILLGSDGDAA